MDELISMIKQSPLVCLAMVGVMGIAWAIHAITSRKKN